MNRREAIVGAASVVAIASVPVAVALASPTVERFICPDITWCEISTKTARDNTWTIRYRHMTRMTLVDGKCHTWELAEVGSERYARWLAEDHKDYGHPPHIQFGGAVGGAVVASKKGDPEFYNRWLAYAATLE